MGRKSKVPWTEDTIHRIINVYGQKVDYFMSEFKNQTKLWKSLVEVIKDDENLPAEVRENITHLNVKRKWSSLLTRFKALFYSSLKPSADTFQLYDFPFYDQMYKLLTDYAARKLAIADSDDDTMNGTIDANVTAYVMNLLNANEQSAIDVSELHAEKENSSPSSEVSRTSKIIEKINELPETSKVVFETTMRLDPNTPFKRSYGISTIVSNRKAFNPTMKREHSGNDLFPQNVKTQKMSSIKKEKLETIEYEVEALDECSFFEGLNFKRSQSFKKSTGSFGGETSTGSERSSENFNSSQESTCPIYVTNGAKEITILEVSDGSVKKSSNRQLTIINHARNSNAALKRKIPMTSGIATNVRNTNNTQLTSRSIGLTINDTRLTSQSMDLTITNKPRQKMFTPIPSCNNSILDVPELDSSIDELRATFKSPQRYILPVSANRNSNSFQRSSLSLVPKKLKYEITELPSLQNRQAAEEPPIWFTSFMKRYDSDSKRVDAKLEKIDEKLNKILGTQREMPQKVLLSPRIAQIKKGY